MFNCTRSLRTILRARKLSLNPGLKPLVESTGASKVSQKSSAQEPPQLERRRRQTHVGTSSPKKHTYSSLSSYVYVSCAHVRVLQSTAITACIRPAAAEAAAEWP